MHDSSDSAATWAAAEVAAVRDDPAARLALAAATYHGLSGRAPDHLPFRRAEMSFMRWEADRGVLNPVAGDPPGSPWWRALNERLLRDGRESVARAAGLHGDMSSPTIGLWMAFIVDPTARTWYRAHNASIVAAYLEHEPLARAESLPERFFLKRMLDYAVIGSRLPGLYDWSAGELDHPGLRELIRDGSPAYVWPESERHVWDPPPLPMAAAALRSETAARLRVRSSRADR
ncbi:MAG: hypothetical protein ABI355_02590 [Solirubrobacteraceae bacterium]